MTRRLFALLTLALSLPVLADESRVPMWQIDGANNTIYLLGSIHLLRKDDYPLPAVIEAAYQDAEVLVMEIDMDDLDPVAAMTTLQTAGLLQGDETLEDLMGPTDWARASAAAERMEIPLHMLNKVEPWYAAITVEIMALSRLGFDANHGIETYFTNKSAADNKPIEGFETLEEQVQFLDGLSPDAQREMLLSTLEEGAQLASMMDALIAAWHKGDTQFFETEILEQMDDYEELYDAILTNRNHRWVRQIENLLKSTDDVLIIVGTLHMVGDDGVPELLRQRGITARQLSSAATLR